MTIPDTGLPDLAGALQDLPEDTVLVQVMSVDQDQVLCTSWILAGVPSTDVLTRLTDLFGPPSVDLIAAASGAVELGAAMLSSEDTKISFRE